MADSGYRREPPRILNRNANGFFEAPGAAPPQPPTQQQAPPVNLYTPSPSNSNYGSNSRPQKPAANIYPSSSTSISGSRSRSRPGENRDPRGPASPPLPAPPSSARYYSPTSSSANSSPPRSRRPSEDVYAGGPSDPRFRRPSASNDGISAMTNDAGRRRPSQDTISRSPPASGPVAEQHPPRGGSLLRPVSPPRRTNTTTPSSSTDSLNAPRGSKDSLRGYSDRERGLDSNASSRSASSRDLSARPERNAERERDKDAGRLRERRERAREPTSNARPPRDEPERLRIPTPSASSRPLTSGKDSAQFDDMLKALDDLHTQTAANPPRSSVHSPTSLTDLRSSPRRSANPSDRPDNGRSSKDYEKLTASLDEMIDSTRNSQLTPREIERRERDKLRAREADIARAKEREQARLAEDRDRAAKTRESGRSRDLPTEMARTTSKASAKIDSEVPSPSSDGPSAEAERAERMDTQETQRKRKEHMRIEQEKRDADRKELQMIAEARRKNNPAERAREGRSREQEPIYDERIIVPEYVKALMMTLRTDQESYPMPEDFSSGQGYGLWQETLGMTYSEVLCELLRAKFIDKPRQSPERPRKESAPMQLFFKVVEARGLIAKEGRSRDPYCTIEYGDIPDDGTEEARKADKERRDKQVMQTETMKGTTTPRWNQHINIPVPNQSQKVMVSIYDRAKEQFLGRIKLPFAEIIEGAQRDGFIKKWYKLTGLGKKDKDKYVGGEILIEAAIKDDGRKDEQTRKPKQDPIAALQSSISLTDLDLRAPYRTLLKACLVLDMNMLGNSITEETDRLLSDETRSLLNIIGRLWGLSDAFMVLAYLKLLFERYKVYEVPQRALFAAFETLKDKMKQKNWLSQYEKPSVVELLENMDEYYRTQLTKYKEIFPKNKPKMALEATILMLRMIFRNPLYRDIHPEKPESFRDELKALLTEAAIARYEKLKELSTPFDTNDVEAMIEGVNKLAELVSEEIEADDKYFKAPFGTELNIVRLTVENYLKYFVLTLESNADEIASDTAVNVASQSVFALYRTVREMDERYAKLVPGLKRMSVNAGFNVERWFAPFVQKWLEHLSFRTLEWVNNAVKADNFEPSPDGITVGQHHSSSITDVFSAVYQELQFINDLGWSDRVQYAGFMQLFAKSVSKAIEQYCDAIALGEIKEIPISSTWGGLFASAQAQVTAISTKGPKEPQDITNESCVKLCNIEYAMAKLDDMYRVMNVSDLTRIIRRHRAVMAQVGEMPAQQLEDNEMTVKGSFRIQLSYAENLKPCTKNGLANPYIIVRVPDGTVVPPPEEAPSMAVPKATHASTASSSSRTSTGSSSAGPTVLNGTACEMARSRSISDTINPTWDESFQVILPPVTKLELAVLSKNLLSADEFAGKAVIDISKGTRLRRKLGDHQTHDVYVEMEPQGRVLIRLTMEGADEDVDFWFRRSKELLGRTRDDFVRSLTARIIPFPREEVLKIIKSHEAAALPAKNFFSSLTTATQLSDLTAAGISINEPCTERDADQALDPLIEYLNKNLGTLADYLSERMAQEVIRRCWDEVVSCIEWSLIPPLYGQIERDRRVLTRRQSSMAGLLLRLMKEFFHADGAGVAMRSLETRKYKQVESVVDVYEYDISRLKREYELDFLKGRDREMVLRLVRVKIEKENLTAEEKEDAKKWLETQLTRRKELVRRA